jgi:hypothetical protein
MLYNTQFFKLAPTYLLLLCPPINIHVSAVSKRSLLYVNVLLITLEVCSDLASWRLRSRTVECTSVINMIYCNLRKRILIIPVVYLCKLARAGARGRVLASSFSNEYFQVPACLGSLCQFHVRMFLRLARSRERKLLDSFLDSLHDNGVYYNPHYSCSEPRCSDVLADARKSQSKIIFPNTILYVC